MNNTDVLISGAGIAGTTLAFWLNKFGFKPTIVETAPALRKGGYAIDFMGAGYDVAEKMGILPGLRSADINFSEIVFVDDKNHQKGSMNYAKVKEFLDGRAFTLLRSDLAKVIYESLDKNVEVIFGDSIRTIEEENDGVLAHFESGLVRRFHLVVGADGLHSNVRRIVFGDEAQFEKYYGYYTSSYTIDDVPLADRTFAMYNVPYKQVAVYSGNGNKTMGFFIFTSKEKLLYERHDVKKQKQILRDAFAGVGWKCPELLAGIDATTDFYFDSVSQVQMQRWSAGRVSLVGDACDCPSLLSGKGSTLAMVGAYILAGELKEANGDHEKAFSRYEEILQPFMEKKQHAARFFAKSFVPKSYFGIWLRNVVFKLMSLPFFSGFFLGGFKDKELQLKEYR